MTDLKITEKKVAGIDGGYLIEKGGEFLADIGKDFEKDGSVVFYSYPNMQSVKWFKKQQKIEGKTAQEVIEKLKPLVLKKPSKVKLGFNGWEKV